MTELQSSDREVISTLFNSTDFVDLFEIHERFVLSLAQILEALERLASLGFVEREALTAKLTKAGREWVVLSRRALFFSPHKDWRVFGARDRIVEENEPYLPDWSRVDKEHFRGLS